MNPSMQAYPPVDGENPMMMFLMMMILCPGLFSGMSQNPMMMILLLSMMSGGKLF